MADSEDLETLKRRGRRRLVGAIALVLAAVIVLPMVFEDAPKSEAPRVSIRIPAENQKPFSPSVPPRAGPDAPSGAGAGAEVSRLELPQVASTSAPAGDGAQAGPPGAGKAAPERAPAKRSASEYVVPVAALASKEKVVELTQRLTEAKIPHFTQPLSTAGGTVTRVRAGPYPSREAAEQAATKLRGMGLKPGKPTPRTD